MPRTLGGAKLFRVVKFQFIVFDIHFHITAINELTALLAAKEADVVAAYLFGSFARHEEIAASDLDIAVLFRESPADRLVNSAVALRGELERRLRLTIDLVPLNNASPDLVHRVLRDGVLLADHAPSLRIAFEVKVRNDYFDLLPHLRRYRGEHPR